MDIYNLIIGIHILSIAFMFFELIYVTIQKPSPMQSHIILMLVATILMFIGYLVELRATNLEVAFMGTFISYIGKPFILNCGFLLICDFYNVKIHKLIYYLLNALSAFVSLSVFTTKKTHLYYTYWSFAPELKYSPLLLGRGPLYYVYLASIIIFFVMSIYIITRELIRNRSKENRIYAHYFGLMLLSGLAGYLVYLTDLSNGYDASIFGLIGSIICLSILFFRYKIFDVLTLAKDNALEDSPTGLIILNEQKELSYANNLGKQLLNNYLSVKLLVNIDNDNSHLKCGPKIYEVNRKTISVHGGRTNISFEFTDVTDSIKYQTNLEEEVEQRTAKIESIQRKIISSFASIVEARSLETGEHILRTSEYVEMTINGLKEMSIYFDVLSEEYIRCLIDVAPLHDIGKISISDAILLKPGKLTKEEFEQMKKHAEAGAKVIEATMLGVEDDNYVKMAIDVAKYHHERFDGTGYPCGLKGNEIPLSARIMAIADCYDALVSKRVYKEAYTKEKACQILNEESGTHFDPMIVKAFLSKINDKLEVL